VTTSSTYNKNSKGPSTLPCTTPLISHLALETLDTTRTYCVRLLNNSSIHLSKLPHIPNRLSL